MSRAPPRHQKRSLRHELQPNSLTLPVATRHGFGQRTQISELKVLFTSSDRSINVDFRTCPQILTVL